MLCTFQPVQQFDSKSFKYVEGQASENQWILVVIVTFQRKVLPLWTWYLTNAWRELVVQRSHNTWENRFKFGTNVHLNSQMNWLELGTQRSKIYVASNMFLGFLNMIIQVGPLGLSSYFVTWTQRSVDYVSVENCQTSRWPHVTLFLFKIVFTSLQRHSTMWQ